MRLCNHCTRPVFFTVKLPAVNGDYRKCLNGLAPNLAGGRVKARSENGCAQILGLTIPHCFPPSVRFAGMKASPSWRWFRQENESKSGTAKNAPVGELNPVWLAHRIGGFSWQTPGMKFGKADSARQSNDPRPLRLRRFGPGPTCPNKQRLTHQQMPNMAQPPQHSRSTLTVTVLSLAK
jgi:hypothetical protein